MGGRITIKMLRTQGKTGPFAALPPLLEGHVYSVEEPLAQLLLDSGIAETAKHGETPEPPPPPEPEPEPPKKTGRRGE
jgi:hypothetical protein